MPRRLPTPEETLRILAAKRTRPQRRPAPPAGRSLAKLIKSLDERFGQGPGMLQARWREIVGDQLARITEPVKLTKARGASPGALEIRVGGAAAALIQHRGQEIIERVNLFLGDGAIGRLRIVQGPLKPRAEAPATPRRRRSAAPLDAAREAELAESLKAAPDGPLKAALTRLGRSVLKEDDAGR
ncbi:MAG TPA: DciA family protein [Caulobacteraceae bacterium]|nr:DciA family protein [Caulobacteraceae bacterium]